MKKFFAALSIVALLSLGVVAQDKKPTAPAASGEAKAKPKKKAKKKVTKSTEATPAATTTPPAKPTPAPKKK